MIVDAFSGALSTGFLYTRHVPKYIFDSYKYALGTNIISGTNYKNNINVTFITDSIDKDISADIKDINLSYGDISAKCYKQMIDTKIKLEDLTIESTNIDTSESGTFSYQKMLNIPCSAVLSNPNSYGVNIKDNLIKNDMEYKAWLNDPTDKYAEEHMRLTYSFETEYNEDEYDAFNITENTVLENGVYITSKNFSNNNISTQASDIMKRGCIGILLSYYDSTHKGVNMIPMLYYEFEKPIYSNNNALNIEWNTNGILRLE